MALAEKPSVIPDEDLVSLQEAVDRVLNGIRDPEAARNSCKEMDLAREEMRRTRGERSLAVELIRDSRDEE